MSNEPIKMKSSNYLDNDSNSSWEWQNDGEKVFIVTKHNHPKEHEHRAEVTKVPIGEMSANPDPIIGEAHRKSAHYYKDGKVKPPKTHNKGKDIDNMGSSEKNKAFRDSYKVDPSKKGTEKNNTNTGSNNNNNGEGKGERERSLTNPERSKTKTNTNTKSNSAQKSSTFRQSLVAKAQTTNNQGNKGKTATSNNGKTANGTVGKGGNSVGGNGTGGKGHGEGGHGGGGIGQGGHSGGQGGYSGGQGGQGGGHGGQGGHGGGYGGHGGGGHGGR